MAFPTTGVIDAFTGAGPTTPPSGSWSKIDAATVNLTLENNQARSLNAAYAGSFWSAATFGPNVEVFATVDALPANDNDILVLYLRAVDLGTAAAFDGYILQIVWRDSAADEWSIYETTNGASTLLGSTVTSNLSLGDKIGFEVIGSTLKAYHYTGGSWSEVMSRTDGTNTVAGNIGATIQATTSRLNDFSGGTVVAGGTTETPTPGGATAGGTGPTANTATAAGGSVAAGSAPAARVDLAAAGATAGGAAPTAAVPAATGGATAAGNGPSALAGVSPGGAIAGGAAPTDGGPVSETPTPGGSSAGGFQVTAAAAVVLQGATAAGVPVTLALVPLTRGGAIAGGQITDPSGPSITWPTGTQGRIAEPVTGRIAHPVTGRLRTPVGLLIP